MRRLSPLVVLVLTFALFWVWYRRPAGRGFSHSQSRIPMGLRDFDACNPGAPATARSAFYSGVQAQLAGDSDGAQSAYQIVLSHIPGEPTTRHNLNLL
jgi:hypothetical protein